MYMLVFRGGPCLFVCLDYHCVVHHYKAVIYMFIEIFKILSSKRESLKNPFKQKVKITLPKTSDFAKLTLNTV